MDVQETLHLSAPFTHPLPPSSLNGVPGSLIDLVRGNNNLKPETQREFEMGLDASALKSRITLEFTYYRKKVEDLLLNVEVPSSSGFTTAWQNVASIQNKGFEIGLNAIPVATRDFKWSSNVSFWTNDAEVTELRVPAFNTGAFGASLGTYGSKKERAQHKSLVSVDQMIKLILFPGWRVFGDAEPDFQMSFGENLTYKNWEFSVLVHWKQGGKNINLTALLADFAGTSPDYDKTNLDPDHTIPNGDYRITSFLGGVSARPFVEDGGYFRVREIGLKLPFSKSMVP